MNLAFERIHEGVETFFPEKILCGLVEKEIISISKAVELISGCDFFPVTHPMYHIDTMRKYRPVPKFHTLRHDEKGRWNRPGIMIDFFFWMGKPYRSWQVKFCCRLPVVRVQKIEISYQAFEAGRYLVSGWNVCPEITVDGRRLLEHEVEELARNDGFDSVNDFFAWFNKDFKGVIIHWTDIFY